MIALVTAVGDPAREKETAASLCADLLRQVFGDPTVLTYEKSGRPRLSVPGADLSISHSQGIVLIGLLTRAALPALALPDATVTFLDGEGEAIGVDVEAAAGRTADRCLRIARRFFFPGEAAALHVLPRDEQVPAFLALWTQKEAAVKATGEGLSGLSRVNTQAPLPGRVFLTPPPLFGKREAIAAICLLKNA